METKLMWIKENIAKTERAYNLAQREYERAKWELKQYQRQCSHPHATISPGYQGGGIYYTKCVCPDCERSGYRYIPEYHMKKHNDWNNRYPQEQITIENAIEIGRQIGDNMFESDKWWGPVDDYPALLLRSGLGTHE